PPVARRLGRVRDGEPRLRRRRQRPRRARGRGARPGPAPGPRAGDAAGASPRPEARLLHAHLFLRPELDPGAAAAIGAGAAALTLLTSVAAVRCGFRSARWAHAYEASARVLLGEGARLAPTFVAPLGPDPEALAEVAAAAATRAAATDLEALVGDRRVLLRV